MKYYIPNIEEFSPGFEYELIPSVGYTIFNFGASDQNFETTWATEYSKGTYGVKDVSPFGGALASIRSGIKNKKCRVKYLDRKDIEDLGFKLEYEQTVGDDGFKQYYSKNKTRLIFRKLFNISYSLITVDDSENYSDFEFHGSIKNKYELRKLLIQLSIE